MTGAAAVFWLSFSVCAWVYFGYPALLWALSRIRPRPVREEDAHVPVTFIIPAFNEERLIASKIENTLALDYPPELIEVLVVSNGSTDGTDDVVRSWSDSRVRLISLPEPGKIAALNSGAHAAVGEILVFSDADFLLGRDTLRLMVGKFADPEVGGVCGARGGGEEGSDATAEGENLYHRYDRWQKELESRIGSVFAADGLLYAIRRSLYVPVANTAQADDIAISARVPLQGARLLFEPRAVAREQPGCAPAAGEFRRKIRVTNHSVRALLNLRSRLFTSGFYSVELLSHKLVRHLVPFAMIPLLITNALLAPRSRFFRAVLVPHVLFYVLAALGAVLRGTRAGRSRIFYAPYYLSYVNAAALLGVLSILRGKRLEAWSSRGAAPAAKQSLPGSGPETSPVSSRAGRPGTFR